MIVLLLAVAGGLGAVARFVVDTAVKKRLERNTPVMAFPWGVVAINVSGSLLLGLIAGAVVFRDGSTDVQTVLGTGFCGGYTTFSTAAVDTVRLVQAGRRAEASLNLLGTVVASVAACAAGLAVAAAVG